MTNPAAAMRMLLTYAVCIPLAITVGYLLANPLDYSTLGFLGILIAVIISPVFIKWYYPIMVFALGSPIIMFFLKGSPPFSQVMVLMGLSIAVVERTLNSDRRFLIVPSIIWPLMFTLGMVMITAKLTGGIGFHALSSGDDAIVGGGKKYVSLFVGIATYFALASRTIPPERHRLYLMLFFLPPTLTLVSDLFPYLPSPLNYINLLIPPSGYNSDATDLGSMGSQMKRFVGLGTLASVFISFLLARYGLREIFFGGRLWRLVLLVFLPVLVLAGGFRSVLILLGATMASLFFMEGLHRTRLLLPALMGLILAATLLVPFAGKLPYAMQRTLSFLPLSNLDPMAVADAEGSSEWRYQMWRDVWPQVPQYLLLGKGYGLTKDDYTRIGAEGTFVNGAAEKFDASSVGLAVSGDYHNGSLSVLMPFGMWGAISFLWFSLAGLRLLYRNYRYGDPALQTINRFFFVSGVIYWLGFFFIFGGYSNAIGYYGGLFGMSVAFNGGLREPAPKTASNPLIKPLPASAPMTATEI